MVRLLLIIFVMTRRPLKGQGLLIFEILQSHSILFTVGRTPLEEWSAGRRDLYLTAHNIHKRVTSMTPAGLESEIPTSERPQTHPLDRAALGIGLLLIYLFQTPFVYHSWIINQRHRTKNTCGLLLLFCCQRKVRTSRSFMTEHFRT